MRLYPTRRNAALAAACGLLIAGLALPAAAASVSVAPRFRVKDLRGATLDLTELLHRGPVLLDFWATWCKPCVESLPALEAWQRRYAPQGLTVIGVSVDAPRNYPRVRPFVASLGLTYPMAIDRDGRLQQLYQVLAVPTAFLIDSSGAIVRTRTGYRPGEDEAFEAAIRAALPSAPGP